MARRLMALVGLALVGVLALAGTVTAGWWALVTVDALPETVRAGEPLRLGMMVRQHGETPVHKVDGKPLRPLFVARHEATGAEVAAEGVADNEVGRFTVEVTFPHAGTWEWTVDPQPLGGKTEPVLLEVLPAPAAVETEVAGVVAPAPPGSRMLLQGAGIVWLVAGLGLALRRRR